MRSEKFAIFGQYLAESWKWYKIGPWLLRNVNSKSHVPDLSVSIPMTLSDLERLDTVASPGFCSSRDTRMLADLN